MNSQDYKAIIRKISFNLLKKRFPGLEKKHIEEVARMIGLNVHARMYGANVDGVDSPIWNIYMDNNRPEPKIDAKDLLDYEKDNYHYSTVDC